MPVKKYKPTSPGRRFMSVSAFEDITKGKKPEKRLLVSLKKDSGRNAQGKITVRHQGGGHRKLYRIIDFKRNKPDRKSTRLNSSHLVISYAVFCLKKKNSR